MQEKKHYFSSMFGRKVITVIIAVTIFYILMVVYSDANQMIKYLHNIDIGFVSLIILSFLISILIKSVRQSYLLNSISIRLGFVQNVVLYIAGLSMTITPGGMGQMIKSHYLLKHQDQPISKTLPIVIAERYNDILALVSFTILFAAIENLTILMIPIFAIGMVIAIGGVMIRNRNLFQFLQALSMKISIFKGLKNSSAEFNSTLVSLFENRKLFFCWLLSMAAFFFDAVGIFMCFQSLKLNFDFGFTTAFGFSSIVLGAISFIPAGAGVTEFSFVQLLSHYGVEISEATAVVLLVRLTSMWFLTFLGIVATKFITRNSKLAAATVDSKKITR
jgi:glycosyltransferase 2 family protein